ncbi:MAG: hypothetical protein IT535_00535 [Bauldia sp.]|nr:hypothetical protein [Bauldia sp.]
MSNLPTELIESFTEGVERTAARVALRVGLILAGCLAALLAVVFLFVAAYTGLVILLGPFPAQLGLALLFAIAAAILFAVGSRVSFHRSVRHHRPAADAAAHPGEPPYDDWAGRMAGSVAYAFAEGLMRGRQRKPDGPAAPPDGA